jgi:hypothetical protein
MMPTRRRRIPGTDDAEDLDGAAGSEEERAPEAVSV